jgi:hypothetical protein
VIKVVSEFRQVDGYPVSFTNKTDRHDIAEILLKIASNTITVTLSLSIKLRQLHSNIKCMNEEFQDTKEVISIRISKNRQHNSKKKKYKRTNNDLQSIHIKLKIE